MNGIFVSYRRDDGASEAGRIADRLQLHFGEEHVFQDVDNIPLGIDFREHINRQLDHCQLFLAVIGDKWLDILHERQSNPDTMDYVYYEIAAVLERKNIPIIPILVGQASVPREAELPAAIRSLSYRNGIAIRSDETFDAQMQTLIAEIEQHLGKPGRLQDTINPEVEKKITPQKDAYSGSLLKRGCSAHIGKLSIAITVCIGLFIVLDVFRTQSIPTSTSPPEISESPATITNEDAPREGSGTSDVTTEPPTVITRFGPTATELSLPSGSFAAMIADSISASRGNLPASFTWNTVTFEQNSARPQGALRDELRGIARILTAYPTLRLDIRGHIDSSEDDVTLSTSRARPIYNALIEAGIPRDRITFRGMYANEPLAQSNSERGRSMNRRVELVFLEAR